MHQAHRPASASAAKLSFRGHVRSTCPCSGLIEPTLGSAGPRAWRAWPASSPASRDAGSGARSIDCQAAGREVIDARPLAVDVGQRCRALAALVRADLDLLRDASPLDHIAFAHLERDRCRDHRHVLAARRASRRSFRWRRPDRRASPGEAPCPCSSSPTSGGTAPTHREPGTNRYPACAQAPRQAPAPADSIEILAANPHGRSPNPSTCGGHKTNFASPSWRPQPLTSISASGLLDPAALLVRLPIGDRRTPAPWPRPSAPARPRPRPRPRRRTAARPGHSPRHPAASARRRSGIAPSRRSDCGRRW